MNIKRNIIFALESRKKNGVPIVENVPIRMRVIFVNPEKPDVPLNKNDAFQKVQKRRVQEKR